MDLNNTDLMSAVVVHKCILKRVTHNEDKMVKLLPDRLLMRRLQIETQSALSSVCVVLLRGISRANNKSGPH